MRLITPTIKILYVTPELMKMEFFQSVIERLYNRGLLSLFVVDEV